MKRAAVVNTREEVVEGQRVTVKVIEARPIPDPRDEPIPSRDDSRSPWQRDKQYEHWK